MAIVVFALLGFLAVILVAAGLIILAKLHWRSNEEYPAVSQPNGDLNSATGAAAAPSPPAALSPPDDLAYLDRGTLVIRLYALLTGNGADSLRSLGSNGIFHTRSGTRITVFHSDDKLCVVVFARDPGTDKVWRIVHSLSELFVLFAVEDFQAGDSGAGAIAVSQVRNTSIDGLGKMPAEALRILLEALCVSYAVGYLE